MLGLKSRKGLSAFTKLEFGVILSVVAILSGILVPILNSAKTRAKKMGTSYSLYQINTGLKQYQEDWVRFPPNNGPESRAAPESLFHYLCNPRLSTKHPYLEPQSGIQTSDFSFSGRDSKIQPIPSQNGFPEIADGFGYPINYDSINPIHNFDSFDIWSNGENHENNYGIDKSDDIGNWRR